MIGGAFCDSAGEVPLMSNATIARLLMVVILTPKRRRVQGEWKRGQLARLALLLPQ